jgi:hypothetical protein
MYMRTICIVADLLHSWMLRKCLGWRSTGGTASQSSCFTRYVCSIQLASDARECISEVYTQIEPGGRHWLEHSANTLNFCAAITALQDGKMVDKVVGE